MTARSGAFVERREAERLHVRITQAKLRGAKLGSEKGINDNLPAMLLEAMKSPRCAVMIARGDLSVECGFERMAEVQEEILWLCEAAHVPVIWATQVLETLAKERSMLRELPARPRPRSRPSLWTGGCGISEAAYLLPCCRCGSAAISIRRSTPLAGC
jgi:hypothetical protein